ncbi:MAG: hypothetical protein U5L00_17560 [Desulfovermiculus sp.]|nr:hypothetical protein [Desulfovermiculus sp.]
MSEYQYYDFLAIDRQLTSEEMSALRKISSRVQSTPARLTNVYNFGDFKGNPTDLVLRYFDAHVYMANWGSAVFMISIPFEVISRENPEAVQVMGFLELRGTKNYWVITWSLRDEPEELDRFAMDNGEWMQRLLPIREELLRGDLRSLYIGWLAEETKEEFDDSELEPLARKIFSRISSVHARTHAPNASRLHSRLRTSSTCSFKLPASPFTKRSPTSKTTCI